MSALAIRLLLSEAVDEAAGAGREDERETIAACQRGESEAFARLVERYQRPIYRLCYRYTGNHDDASDMAQEALLRAYRAIGRFRGESAFSTWLYRIAVNACLNFRAARRPPFDELPENLPDAALPTTERLEQRERERSVRDAVARLPEKQRATVVLKVFQELTHEEVAAVLGASVGTVKANLFHALRNLRKLMIGEK